MYSILSNRLTECYFAEQQGVDFAYAKTTRGQKTPDYIIDLKGKTAVVEIGGKGKGRTQFKGIDYDTKIVLYHTTGQGGYSRRPRPGSSVPLYCISFG